MGIGERGEDLGGWVTAVRGVGAAVAHRTMQGRPALVTRPGWQ
jgi:hypothetical protein